MAYSYWFDVINSRVDLASLPLFALFAALWAALFIYGEGTPLARLASLFGIFMCVSAAMLLEKHRVRALDHLIGANYMIFLISWYCNVASQQVLSHIVELPWWCYTVLSLVSGIYVPWLGYKYLMRHPDSRWVRLAAILLGQKLKKG
ncbi:MAG: hypothetical protein K2N91_08800 [Muribaculaceae bacterium]|nr:hypothetical protein [Muribaculaceae bacterium]